jgi:uncharacterized Zn finger protein
MAPARGLNHAKVMHRSISRLLARIRRIGGSVWLPTRLVDCERCGSDVVNPVSWEQLDETCWWIRLRCGECGFVREVKASDEEAKRFDAELDRGVREIAAAVARIDRKQMIAECDALRVALQQGLISADDFHV